MSLEVYVFNSLSVTAEQVFEETSLPAFPEREILLTQIAAEIPAINWVNEVCGQITNPDFVGQIGLGKYNIKIIYFTINGGENPIKLILALCTLNRWAAYTPENEHFLTPEMDSKKYWQEYKEYKGIIAHVFHSDKRPRKK
jgi:hypothetical protein